MSPSQINLLYLIGLSLMCVTVGMQSMNALEAWHRGRRRFLTELLKAIAVFMFAVAIFIKLYLVISS